MGPQRSPNSSPSSMRQKSLQLLPIRYWSVQRHPPLYSCHRATAQVRTQRPDHHIVGHHPTEDSPSPVTCHCRWLAPAPFSSREADLIGTQRFMSLSSNIKSLMASSRQNYSHHPFLNHLRKLTPQGSCVSTPSMYFLSLRRVMSFLIAFGVIWTGKAADKGHKWAACNRAYTRIRDRGKNA